MYKQNSLISKSVFLVLLAFSSATLAKTSDAEQPIYIEADQVEIRDREGLSIYRGNVRITQGTLRISGDEIRIRSDNQGLQKVHISGKPAYFYQLTDLEEEISAQGEEMEYQAKEGMLILDRNAILVQHDNRFTSEHIVYNTQTNIVKAGTGNETGKSTPPRVTITIMPEKPASTKTATEETGTTPPNPEAKQTQ